MSLNFERSKEEKNPGGSLNAGVTLKVRVEVSKFKKQISMQ
jgi:hypothetical protein